MSAAHNAELRIIEIVMRFVVALKRMGMSTTVLRVEIAGSPLGFVTNSKPLRFQGFRFNALMPTHRANLSASDLSISPGLARRNIL